MNKKYSIIIPVFNAEKTIKRCLDSIVFQKQEYFEIIIIDDGSTDRSLEICKDYKEHDNRIEIIFQKNSGPSAARNKGIKKAKGKYIMFVDADDYIEKNFFETIDNYIQQDIDILKFNVKYHGNRISEDIFNTLSFNISSGEEVLEKLIESKKIFATPWMYIIKKSIFIKNNLFFSKRRIHEDYGLMPCLIIKSLKIKGTDYIGYNYVYRRGSLSTNQSYKEIVRRSFDMLIHYDFLNEFAINNIKEEQLKKKFKNYIEDNLIKKINRLKGKELIKFNDELNKRNVVVKHE